MNRLYASKIGMSPYEAFFGKKPNLSNLRALGCQCWFLIPKEKRNTKLDPLMEEARLLAYDEGDNYVVYNVRTKKIERSRNVIFNENPSPASLPDPAYDLNITGMNQEHEYDSQDRYIPIDFLRPLLENPFNIRSTSPPSPTVEDDPEDQTRAPNALDPSNPALFEEDLAWSNDEMAGGRGVLVEPQPVSRQVVNMDIPLETTIDISQEDPLHDDEYHDQSPLQHDQATFEHFFSRLDPVPDDRSRDQSYVQPIQRIQSNRKKYSRNPHYFKISVPPAFLANINRWQDNPFSFFTEGSLHIDPTESPLFQLYIYLKDLEGRREKDILRSRLIKVLYYRLKNRLCINNVRPNDVEIVAQIISKTGTMRGDLKEVKETISKWIKEGKRLDVLCKDISRTDSLENKHLGVLFCLPYDTHDK
ncbi:hypothetical protein PDIDSM_3201 [Penicillium digitatum]|nr:hypothetical protein PDIDSM_3201 [Penicillium digitatum]